MFQFLKDYFSFSTRELNGVLVLFFITLMIWILPAGISFFESNPLSEFKNLDQKIDSLKSAAHQESFKAAKTGDSISKQTQVILPNVKSKPLSTATRNKQFVSKRTPQQVDPNLADSAKLVQLKGIGPVLSKRIMKYRDLLGGFYSAEQLKEVYGLSEETYNQITPYLRITKTSVRTINVNKADYRTLIRHPYIDKNVTKGILDLRKRQKIENLAWLKDSLILSDELFHKLSPYLKTHD